MKPLSEDQIAVLRAVDAVGDKPLPKWADIQTHVPSLTEGEVMEQWGSLVALRLVDAIGMGICLTPKGKTALKKLSRAT